MFEASARPPARGRSLELFFRRAVLGACLACRDVEGAASPGSGGAGVVQGTQTSKVTSSGSSLRVTTTLSSQSCGM